MSERLHRLLAVVRADFLIRLRRPSTAVVFVLLSILPYFWIPLPATGRALIVIRDQRALYTSATIGMATALIATIFIGLVGFYVISNALRRDVLTRCGYVAASTTMRGSEYIVGKFLGNVAFLTVFTLGYMATAMAMVLVRGEAPLEPLVFAGQYLLLLPPMIVFVSAISILFECTPVLRSKFGDVLYFFLWVGTTGTITASLEQGTGPKWLAYFDLSGMGLLLLQMKQYYHTTSLSIGATTFDAAKGVFQFSGLHLNDGWLAARLAASLWPLSLLAIARLFFHRFDPARVRSAPDAKSRGSWLGRLNFIAKPIARLFVRGGNALVSLAGSSSFARSAATDAVATIAAFPLTSIAMIGFAIAALASPSAKTLLVGVMPIAFAGCAIAIADIASREKRSATSALIFATPSLRTAFVWWKFASALLVAFAFLGVPFLRVLLLQPASALPLAIGILFTAAAATTLGIVSSNPKTFIVGFLTFWYIALSDKGQTPTFDFAGWFGTATPRVLASYAALSFVLLIIAELFHRQELRRRW
ncbi:MAG TPA: hypothetical protein VHW00_12985 [Thermoanaerobaculia bacterium]|nr:hypothetical protein [Thermoanaerobaculia bacterium]